MKQRRTPFGLRMTDDLKEWVDQKAKREGRSANNLIVHLLSEAKEAEQESEKAAG